MYTSKKIWVYASLIRYLSRSYAKQSERIKKMMIIHNWNPVFRHYGYLPKYMDIFSWVFSSICPFSCEYFPWHLNICTWLFPFQFISVPCGYAHQNFLPEVCVRHWCVMVKCLPHRVREGQVFFFLMVVGYQSTAMAKFHRQNHVLSLRKGNTSTDLNTL